MCDTISYNSNIKRFCPYADENIMLGEYCTDDDHPTEKGERVDEWLHSDIDDLIDMEYPTEKGGAE
jgi:hypothetical protein